MRGNINQALEQLEMKTGLIKRATESGVIKLKPLASNDFFYLITSGENPDAKMIISVEDYTGDVGESVSVEVAKLIYQLIDMVFVKKVPMPQGMNYLVNMKIQFDTILEAMAYVKRNYKLIPMITFSVSPGTNTIKVSILTHLLRVEDSRKLRIKVKNALGEEVYAPQVYDKVLVSYISKTIFMKDSHQKEYSLGTYVDLVKLLELIQVEGRNSWMVIANSDSLLQVMWLQFTKYVSSEILPKDYSIGKSSSPIVLLIDKGSLLVESLVHPPNNLVSRAVEKAKILALGFVLEYSGYKGKSYKLLKLRDRFVKTDEKQYNFKLVSLDEVLGRLALGTGSLLY